ncbi:hypothetical protein [Mycolicibacterium phlei]|uniref:hypothetical protein n=1 Tax=Mycolicibacterium phlei TaxID=1771 RepID=UPI0002DB1493|nr:hypothetical protein [Mycolicibacterium phlei]
MIGPRDSIIRMLHGEELTVEEIVRDHSPFVDSDDLYWNEFSHLWVDKIHDHVGEGD